MRRPHSILVLSIVALIALAVAVPAVNAAIGVLVGNGVVIFIRIGAAALTLRSPANSNRRSAR